MSKQPVIQIGDVTLTQQRRDSFTVTYGKQVKTGLGYHMAALELGACLMHQAACEGKLDNRETGKQ